MRKYILLFSFIITCIGLDAQHLTRKAFIGIMMEPLKADSTRNPKLPKVEGVLIKNTVPGSTAEASGLAPGDILVKLGDSTITSVP